MSLDGHPGFDCVRHKEKECMLFVIFKYCYKEKLSGCDIIFEWVAIMIIMYKKQSSNSILWDSSDRLWNDKGIAVRISSHLASWLHLFWENARGKLYLAVYQYA